MDKFYYNTVGKTPLIQITDRIWAKLETYNPTGSIKDRMVHYVANMSKRQGSLRPGMTLVEATSGNTGIALSAYGAANGHTVKIIMPKNMSEERKQMMRLLGAEIIEVNDSDFQGAIFMRDEMCKDENVWSPCQFENELNVECHQLTTAHEIHGDLRSVGMWSKKWDAFVCGSGTGGTMMGVISHNKSISECKHVKHVLMIPEENATEHGIQGVNDGADFLLNRALVDDIIKVRTKDAINRAKLLARENGLLVGISAGANICASEEWIRRNPDASGIVVTVLCDRGERYMSVFS